MDLPNVGGRIDCLVVKASLAFSPIHAKRLKMRSAIPDTAENIQDVDIVGFSIHPLNGSHQGRWCIGLNGNLRIMFAFDNSNAYILDYQGYYK